MERDPTTAREWQEAIDAAAELSMAGSISKPPPVVT
jgi:hypothetical protein